MSRTQNTAESRCICHSWDMQIEIKEGDFYDPENKLPRRKDGKKYRIMWRGCPQHNGNTNRIRPNAGDAAAAAEKAGDSCYSSKELLYQP